MYLIPVIDAKQGIAVQAVAGDRANYCPLKSCLFEQPTLASVAEAYQRRFGCPTLYLADIDALTGRPPQWSIYEVVARTGAALWLDAGVSNVRRAQQILQVLDDARHRLIIAAETLVAKADLSDLAHCVGSDRLIFSLDLRHGKLNTPCAAWQAMPLSEVVAEVVACGIERFIVLDLADVGVSSGSSTLSLVREILAQHPHLNVITGGGVRNKADLVAIQSSGCEAALVATALHLGQLQPADLVEFTFPLLS